VATLDKDIGPNIRMNPFWMSNMPADKLALLVYCDAAGWLTEWA